MLVLSFNTILGNCSELVVEFVMLHFIVSYVLFVDFSLYCIYVQQLSEKKTFYYYCKTCVAKPPFHTPRILFPAVPYHSKSMPRYVFLIGTCAPNLLTFM